MTPKLPGRLVPTVNFLPDAMRFEILIHVFNVNIRYFYNLQFTDFILQVNLLSVDNLF